MRLRLEIQERRIDDLITTMDAMQDDELKSHFAKYVCIKVSGYLENVVKTLVSKYIEKSCPSAIQTFVKNKMRNTTNLSTDKMLLFLENFDKNWRDKFEDEISEKASSSLNSIIANRNQIAHGGQDNISPRTIKEYYSDLKDVVKILQNTIKK